MADSKTLPQNNAGEGCYSYVLASVIDGNYNLIEYSANGCGLDAGNHNIIGQDPNLGILYSNGGSTPTQALRYPSPAIDFIPVGVNGCTPGASADQRGAGRAGDHLYGANSGGLSCDIGAFEYNSKRKPTAVQLNDFTASSENSFGLALISGGVLLVSSLFFLVIWHYQKQ